jgi:hypothetical protein
MKPVLAAGLLLFCSVTRAQPTFWDVQSGDSVAAGDLYFQEQLTVNQEGLNSGTIFTRGFRKGFEAGITVHQLTHRFASHSDVIEKSTSEPEKNADLLVNLQKRFDLNQWYSIGVGTRSGINVPGSSAEICYSGFAFVNNRFSIPRTDHRFVLGMYYATLFYAGEGNSAGLMAGMQIGLIRDKLSLITDFISGNNAISMISTGLNFSFSQNVQAGLGAQLPTPGSENSAGFILQLTVK